MRRVRATIVQNEFGRYLDAAQAEPVIITSHGRDKAVLISMGEYDRLNATVGSIGVGPGFRDAEPQPHAEKTLMPRGRVNNPVSLALSIINTSTPIVIDEAELRDAVRNPNTKYRAQARLLLNEVSESVLAGLVIRQFVTWRELAELAQRVGIDSGDKAAFIRDMAGLALG